jgi:transposase, IS4 family
LLRLFCKLAASDDRRYIALYFDLLKTKPDARDARTHLSNEPVKRKQMGASFAWSAELCAVTAESPSGAQCRRTGAAIAGGTAANGGSDPPFIHDGVERPIHRPSDKADRELYYSGKKKRHTLNNILIVDGSGGIHFLSDTYEGRVHDKRIADEAQYTLPIGSLPYQDAGFQDAGFRDAGFQGFDLPGVLVMQPKKKPRNGTLTPQEKEENRRISSVRVRIEHFIGDIKRYRIIRDIIRYSCSEFRDAVMETCCGLHNFRMRLKRKKYAENQSKH